MSAAELRALAGALNYQSWSEWRTEDENKFAQAAEIIELIAWAEERCLDVRRFGSSWIAYSGRLEFYGDTFLDTLRRAREAAR